MNTESRPAAARTLYDKIWDAHVVDRQDDGTCLLYIDRHLVHEVTSPQAFEGLRMTGRTVRAPDRTIAVPDHNVPTTWDREQGIDNPESRIQVDALDRNAREFGVVYYPVNDIRQGIVHIVGPEQGWTLPGMTVVCGDSHTATHGAFGALAHGIGTSEVEHVLATQTLILSPSKTMEVRVDGTLGFGVSAKDVVLAIIGRIGAAGGTGTGGTDMGTGLGGEVDQADAELTAVEVAAAEAAQGESDELRVTLRNGTAVVRRVPIGVDGQPRPDEARRTRTLSLTRTLTSP